MNETQFTAALVTPIADALDEQARRYDRKRRETREAEEADGENYSWTWNYYEGKAVAYEDAAGRIRALLEDVESKVRLEPGA
jgi:hypothetical protein